MLCEAGIVFGDVCVCMSVCLGVCRDASCRSPACFSSVTRSVSKCYTEALHIVRHDDLSHANVACKFLWIDTARLQIMLQRVLVSLPLPTTVACAMFKLTIESLLRQPVIVHTDCVSCPAKLG